MDNKCIECVNRYGELCSEECNSTCEYAKALNKLKQYGSIDDIVEVMNGNRFPAVFVDKDHIDFTYKIVCAAKDGII